MKTNLMLMLVLLLAVAATLGIMRSGAAPSGLGWSPEIVEFTATPPVIHPGEPVTLAWRTRGTVSVAMEWGPETPSRDAVQLRAGLPSSGTMTVQPAADTVYELRCYTASGPMCLPAKASVRAR